MLLDACSIAPTNWQRLSIKDVCQRITSGGTPSRKKPAYYLNGTIGWVKTKELRDQFIDDTEEAITFEAVSASSAKLLSKNTILLAMYGATVGMLGILAKEMACNQACCAMLLKDEFDRDYFFYQLLFHRKQLKSLATGAAQQNLSGQQIKELILPFPSLNEQKNIGLSLRSIDSRIALLKETNSTLGAIAQALFKSWFVDFDPVRAKKEGRLPEGMDAETAALFPDAFEKTELGELPIGWKVQLLENFLDVLETGRRPKGGVSAITSGVPSVGAESILKIGEFDYSKLKFVSIDFFEKMKSGKLQSRDVLLYKDGGKPGVFLPRVSMFGDGFPFDVCGINEHVFRMRIKKPFGQTFLYFWLWSDSVMHELKHRGGKAAIPGINQSDVKELKIAVPDKEILNSFEAITEPIVTKLLANSKAIKTLSDLRDTLLPRLISGR